MSRRARQRQHARPWESPDALSTGPDDEDDQQIGDWSDGCGDGEEYEDSGASQ
jgi:hypothetical protein